jgi:hypothetical protein
MLYLLLLSSHSRPKCKLKFEIRQRGRAGASQRYYLANVFLHKLPAHPDNARGGDATGL